MDLVGSSSSKSSLPGRGLALAVAALLAVPAGAAGAELTREEYVAKLEPICKANSEANSRILKGVKGQVQQDKLVPAGKRFVRASGALGRSVTQMAAVPKPSADEVKLDKWFDYLKREKELLRAIGQALKAKDKFKAQKQAVELNRNNNKANNTVISFGFKECRIDSSRFL
jgi:hypothetical protein